MPPIPGDRARLEKVELRAVPPRHRDGRRRSDARPHRLGALDPSGAPASLSKPVIADLLRGELGFRGLVVTDALDMAGVKLAWTGEAAVRAINAGADMILLPPDPRWRSPAIARAVREDRSSESRLDESVLRVLALKDKAGLAKERIVDIARVADEVGRPEDVEKASEIARQSITVVRNDAEHLAAARRRAVAHPAPGDVERQPQRRDPGHRRGRTGSAAHPHDTFTLGPEVSQETTQKILAAVPEHTHVVVSAFVKVMATKGTAAMSASHARLIDRLLLDGRPVVIVSYGSPYLLQQFPRTPAYVAAYGSAESSQRAATAALFGEFPVSGKLPVTLPGLYDRGQGVPIPSYAMTLARSAPEAAGFAPDAMRAVDAVVDGFVTAKAFPGGVLAVGHQGSLVDLKAFGRQTYDSGSPEVTTDTLYDLASLTKVIVTTTMAMILVDEGKLTLSEAGAALHSRVPRRREGQGHGARTC